MENVALTGILSPDRPASNESLYLLHYSGRQCVLECVCIYINIYRPICVVYLYVCMCVC